MADAAPDPPSRPLPSRRLCAMGIGGRLWAAFLVVAGLTMTGGAIAWVSYERTQSALDRVIEERFPLSTDLSRLAHAAGQMLAATPDLLMATTPWDLQERWDRSATAEAALGNAIRDVASHMADDEGLDDLANRVNRISANLQVVMSTARHAQANREEINAAVLKLDDLGQAFRHVLLNRRSLTDPAVVPTETINRSLGLLREVRTATDRDVLIQLRDRLDQAMEHLTPDVMDRLPASAGTYIWMLRDLATGPQSLPELRIREFVIDAFAEVGLADARRLADELNDGVTGLLDRERAAARREREHVVAVLNGSRLLIGLSAGLSVALALMVAWLYVGRRIVARLVRLAQAMRRIASGELTTPIPLDGADEVTDMASALVVFRDAMVEQQRTSETIAHLARQDPLTGLPNRYGIEERLQDLNRANAQAALFHLNPAGFKEINETFGQEAGDRLLCGLADRLLAWAPDGALVGRLRGDQFVAVLPRPSQADDLVREANALAETLARPLAINELAMEMEVSIGIARIPDDGRSPDALLKQSDMAMQRARSEGITVALYTPALAEAAENRKTIRRDLRRGIDDGQLRLVYQPKIELSTQRIIGSEALVRWGHPDRGMISPKEFIPVAESSGLIVPLGAWVLREACRETRSLMTRRADALSVAVNFSAVQFLRHDVVRDVEQALEETGLPPARLSIEITEGVLINNETRVMERLRTLRDIGVKLAIDDFGTGYSSLSYLKQLPVHCLKIDQSFVRNLTHDSEDRQLSRAIIGIAHDFGLEVVAEGIETKEQAMFLLEEGCDIGQGYYFSRPIPADDYAALVGKNGGRPTILSPGSQTVTAA